MQHIEPLTTHAAMYYMAAGFSPHQHIMGRWVGVFWWDLASSAATAHRAYTAWGVKGIYYNIIYMPTHIHIYSDLLQPKYYDELWNCLNT